MHLCRIHSGSVALQLFSGNYVTGLWFGGVGVVLRLPSEKYKIVSWMKKELEDLIDLLVSFNFVFVIDVIVYSLLV